MCAHGMNQSVVGDRCVVGVDRSASIVLGAGHGLTFSGVANRSIPSRVWIEIP